MAVITVLACIGAILFLIYTMINRKSIDLPYPKGIPVLGNLFQFNRARPDQLLTKWAEELGSMFKVCIFNREIVVLNDYDSIREVLVKKGRDCSGRPFGKGKRVAYLWEYDTSIFINNPGPQWKFLRQMLHSNVKMYDAGLRRVEGVNLSVIADLVRTIRSQGSKSFNPRTHVYNAIMNIICKFLVGRTYSHEDKVFQLFKKVERETASIIGPGSKGSELDVMWWLRHFGNKSFKRIENLRNMRRKLWAMVKEDFVARQQALQAESDTADQESEEQPLGILGVLFDALKHVNKAGSKVPSNLTEKNVMLTFHDLIFAGTTTTANSTYAFLNIMSQHPKVQAQLRAEVDDVVGPNRQVSMTDKGNMPYTRATILELLRYTSIVPLGVTHCAMKDIEIQGHAIPEGTPLITNLWAMHHDQDIWKDPFVFRPDRFLDASGDVVPADHETRKHLMPFSAGTRVCLGESLALGRLFLVVSTMAQMFIMKPGAETVSCDPRTYCTGTTISQPDFTMQFIPRNDTLYV